MAETQSIDDVLVCLMSMGFSVEDGQEAIQSGKITVQEAVDWLIAGKPHVETPALRLRPDAANPFSHNPSLSPASLADVIAQNAMPSDIDQIVSKPSNSRTRDETVADCETESQIVSRLHLTEQQRKKKENFEDKARDEARKKAKEEKMLQKKAHELILKQIAEDREKVKLVRSPAKDSKSDTSTSQSDEKIRKLDEEASGSKSALQIRLPDGRVLRQSFDSSALLREVWNFVSNAHKSMTNMCFMQPFPKKEFGRSEMLLSLCDLGLTPSGSLVLRKQENEPAIIAVVEPVDDPPEEETAMDIPVQPAPAEDHSWGGGNRMDTEEHVSDASVPMPAGDDDEIQDLPEPLQDMFPEDGGLPGMGNMNMGVGEAIGQNFWGVGQMLVPDGHPQASEQQSETASQRAAEAARQRYTQPRADNSTETLEAAAVAIHPVCALSILCLRHISARLNDPRNMLLSVGGISQELAQKILTYLVKEKLLKCKNLQAFIPCYLRKLVLDCYPYATNDLLLGVRLHTHLAHLSLSYCPLLTDSGFQVLASLKKLKFLNMRSCKQLTNKCISTISEFTQLSTLILEETGITDAGIEEYVLSKPQCLQHLNINRTSVTQKIFISLKGIPTLRALLLEQTKVSSLSGVESMGSLECLDVAFTTIVTESLTCLSKLIGLTYLNIANTENVHGDMALQHIANLRLHSLILPSRHTTTNQSMVFLSALPLTSLDLTNYIHVGDEGMVHIGKIYSLKKLLLCNTKITDEGMIYLQGLTNLEVLNLDRTQVSDKGVSIIKDFPCLQELSLSSTLVSSRFLVAGTLNRCHYLSKLNLSRTNVSTKGVMSLILPSLTLLNLDSSKVRPQLLQVLPGCPLLLRISMTNVIPLTDDDGDME